MSSANDNNEQYSGSSDGNGETSNTKECISCEQNNDVNNITEGIDSVAILDSTSTCANCGKEGNSDNMNTCNKCKSVRYCNAACKKKHRTKHKKACARRVAELYDEKLFKEPPPREECPICMLPLPIDANQMGYKSCCGKTICDGCVYAMKMSEGKDLCAFCRTPYATSDEEHIKRIKKLIEKDNPEAYYLLAGCYDAGIYGTPQDYQKANELWLKAGELGYSEAYHNLGVAYRDGMGVEVDKIKAKHYFELAAINGSAQARNNLAVLEGQAGNQHRAMRHFILAARAGYKTSLEGVKEMGFKRGLVAKDEYASTLRAYHERQKEMKSDERVKAAIYYGNEEHRGRKIGRLEVPERLKDQYERQKYDYDGECVSDSNLKEVVFHTGGLRSIEKGLFCGCKSLERIKLPSTIRTIEESAFYECLRLREVMLNEGLWRINCQAFFRCLSLESITLTSASTSFFMIESCSFRYCTDLREVILTEGMKKISNEPFYGRSSLEQIDSPINMSMDDGAFAGCRSLECLKFPFISARLERIIQVGHTDIETKIDEICGVFEWRDNKLLLPAVETRMMSRLTAGPNWNSVEESLNKIVNLLAFYEFKECTVLFELALWKAMVNQAEEGGGTNPVDRATCRTEVPRRVKDTILQYMFRGYGS